MKPACTRTCLSALWLAWALSLTACAGVGAPHIGAEIRANYEANLPELALYKQRHYAVRLYRITGDARYLPPIYAEMLTDVDQLRQDLHNLDKPAYRLALARAIIAAYRDDSDKYRRRKAALKAGGEIAFAKNLLYHVHEAAVLGLAGRRPFEHSGRALTYLREVDFAGFLLAPDTIRVYAAQLANMVYYLHALGVADLRAEYQQAFREALPPQQRHSGIALQQKVYGMTHIVIAASGFYQHRVERADFAWIYRFFAAEIDRLIAETKADIYTEVALCFLLAGLPEHPVVAKVKAALEQIYDREARMIPAADGELDRASGEHRNVLAVMLYHWPERLHHGPDLSAYPPYRARFGLTDADG